MFSTCEKLKNTKKSKILTRIRCQIRIRQHAKRVAGQGWMELSKVPVVRLAGTIEPRRRTPRDPTTGNDGFGEGWIGVIAFGSETI